MTSGRPTSPTRIGWLRGLEIPTEWTESKVKYVAPGMQAGETITAESIEPEGTYPVYGGNGLRGYTEDKTHQGTCILIGRQGALCGNVHLVSGEFWASEHAIVALSADEVEPRWLAHLLQVMNLGQYSQTAAQPGIGTAQINALPVPVPPSSEQRAIADYLDRETARIDTLIEEQQRLIEMLRERRSAAIDLAICSIGEWPEMQLRRLTSAPINAGVDEQGNAENPREWPRFIRTTDIASLTTLDPAKRVTVSPGAAATADLRRNDLVATRAGATIGKTYIHLSDEDACYAGYLVRIRPDVSKVSPMYIAYWSQSTHYLGQVASGAVKATIENYSAAKYRATTIPIPPLDEQRRIVAYLDEQTAKIDTLIAETERFIELSRERRSALITAAVTGQIDVREAA